LPYDPNHNAPDQRWIDGARKPHLLAGHPLDVFHQGTLRGAVHGPRDANMSFDHPVACIPQLTEYTAYLREHILSLLVHEQIQETNGFAANMRAE
jgi:hypothetical protein